MAESYFILHCNTTVPFDRAKLIMRQSVGEMGWRITGERESEINASASGPAARIALALLSEKCDRFKVSFKVLSNGGTQLTFNINITIRGNDKGRMEEYIYNNLSKIGNPFTKISKALGYRTEWKLFNLSNLLKSKKEDVSFGEHYYIPIEFHDKK